jgi:deoxyadenosine/deoxycytidine kinase
MPIFTVEGIVGAGKTSFLKALEQTKFDKPHVILLEPVDEWMNLRLDGHDQPSIFEKFYNDKERYGFMFQLYALYTRIKQLMTIQTENPDSIIICERSYLSDKYIFAQLLKDMKLLTNEEYHVYQLWHDLSVTISPKFAGVIYLNTDPSICVSRILQRQRKGEEKISFDYINNLYILHEKLAATVDIPLCIIDGNIHSSSDAYQTSVIQKVVEFCNKQAAMVGQESLE